MPQHKVGLLVATLTLTSPAFQPSQEIPAKYSYDGGNLAPPLAWSGAPPDTRSFALICEDPDAGARPWVHWILFNLPAGSTNLEEGVAKSPVLPDRAVQAKNSFGQIGWGGPQPPGGTHHYFFRLYALDEKLDFDSSATVETLRQAMDNHVVGEAELMGTFTRRSE